MSYLPFGYNIGMRWKLLFVLLIIPILAACSVLPDQVVELPVEIVEKSVVVPVPASTSPAPTAVFVTVDQDTDMVLPGVIDREDFTVRYHPEGGLFVGDMVSFEVIAPEDQELEGLKVQVSTPAGELLGPVDFGFHGIGKRPQATLLWAWDTSALEAGEYTLTFSLLPDEEEWQETVTLLPGTAAPYPQPAGEWETAELDCCQVYYISGTEAERDLGMLLETIEEQALSASQHLDIDFEEPVRLTLLPRVLGHGGFASSEISISYLDRNYAGSGLPTVLHHEFVHELDKRLGGDYRPSMFVEGLAVYLTGGHFKQEPLMPRAAALLPPGEGCVSPDAESDVEIKNTPTCTLDMYIPFDDLVDDFYFTQHEIGYLQAGALVEFMVDTWGWSAFDAFYRDIETPGTSQSSAPQQVDPPEVVIDRALLEHFGVSLSELEQMYVEALDGLPVDAVHVEDVRLTVEFYDTVRRYQIHFDPSAYFLTAWLMDGEQMRQKEIVGDVLRHPSSAENIALELMLVEADTALREGDYGKVDRNLEAVSKVLDAADDRRTDFFHADPLAADYFAVVQLVLARGYQPQKISLDGDQLQVWAIQDDPQLILFKFFRTENGWELLAEAQ